MHTQINGVLFDLDGTLADTAIDLVTALNLSLNDFGYSTHPVESLRHAASHGSMALVNAAQPHVSDEQKRVLQQGLLSHYQNVNGQHCVLFDGMAQLLAKLEQLQLPFGIVTNKPARFTRPLLDALQLTHRMQAVISGDSTLHAKPHTAPMLLAAQQLRCQPANILYLGDAERDLLAAQAANMAGGVALWGYLSAIDRPSTWPAVAHFTHPLEILSFVEQRQS